MHIINIALKKLKLNSFNPQTEEVRFSVLFDNGSKIDEIEKSLVITSQEDTAVQIVKEVRQQEKKRHVDMEGDGVLDNYVHVIIRNELSNEKKLALYLKDISDRVKIVKGHNKADGYLNKIAELRGKEFFF